MTSPHTPPKNLKNAVDAARSAMINDIIAMSQGTDEHQYRRKPVVITVIALLFCLVGVTCFLLIFHL
jgi:predicted nucleic acid-binding OB-fold protein